MSTEFTPWEALSGQYQLHPGTALSIVGQRPVLGAGRLGRLLLGQRGIEVSRTLSSVFTLCAHAHRRTANLALAAAQAGSPAPLNEAPVLLWLETARDHLRSMALDWPQRLPQAHADAGNLGWLSGCPLPLGTASAVTDAAEAWQLLAALRAWLEQHILGQSVVAWLAACRDPDAFAAWCRAQAPQLAPAYCLAAWQPIAQTLAPELRCLDLLDEDPALQSARLRQLARSLVEEPDFVQRPTWLGRCAETGAWSRLRHRPAQTRPSAWTRLSARWLELVELAAADSLLPSRGGAPLLATGSLSLGKGQALAWCEMARGLLLHWVQLDADGRVQDYRVLAPTEWNFHPDGALAHALAALSPDDTAAARTLAAAFDPCVVCTV